MDEIFSKKYCRNKYFKLARTIFKFIIKTYKNWEQVLLQKNASICEVKESDDFVFTHTRLHKFSLKLEVNLYLVHTELWPTTFDFIRMSEF